MGAMLLLSTPSPVLPRSPAGAFAGAVLLTALLFSVPAAAQAPPEDAVPPGRAVEITPGHHAVRELRLVKAGGGRVEAARQGDELAFDMAGADGLYDIYLMRLEAGVESCLTCENYEFRRVNALSPTWHPSGKYLIITVQTNAKKRQLDPLRLTSPLRGMGAELWAIARDGRDYFQITRLGERGSAVLDPHFSYEGDLLVWSERLTNRQPPWGEWGLRVVDFKIKRGLPRVGQGRVYSSGIGAGLVVAHGFTPDDRGLFASAVSGGLLQPDLLRIDLESGAAERLSVAPDQSDRLVVAVPQGDDLVWVSTRNLGEPRSGWPEKNELWLRSAGGHLQERLTFFNDPRSALPLEDAMIDDLSWMADGERLLLHVVSRGPGGEPQEGLYVLRLKGERRR